MLSKLLKPGLVRPGGFAAGTVPYGPEVRARLCADVGPPVTDSLEPESETAP